MTYRCRKCNRLVSQKEIIITTSGEHNPFSSIPYTSYYCKKCWKELEVEWKNFKRKRMIPQISGTQQSLLGLIIFFILFPSSIILPMAISVGHDLGGITNLWAWAILLGLPLAFVFFVLGFMLTIDSTIGEDKPPFEDWV